MRIKASIFLFLLILGYGSIQAQHYSLYNSRTLAESVENPWVSAFEDACGIVASNFFIPTVNGDGFLQGDGAEAGRNFLFWNEKLEEPLSDPQGKNHLNVYGHMNVITIKYLFDKANQTEFLFDHSVKSMSAATVKNMTVNLAQGEGFISSTPYTSDMGPMNMNLFHYLYAETSLGVRRRFDETFAAGIKLSYLSGIAHMDAGIGYSEGVYYPGTDEMEFMMRGQAEYTTYSNDLGISDFLPSFRNPGFSISGGIEKKMSETFKFTLGIKDLGLINWKEKGEQVILAPEDVISVENFSVLTKNRAEAEIDDIRAQYAEAHTYRTALPTRFEAGASLNVHPNYTANVLVGYFTKYKRADLNLINDFKYQDFHLILNAGYNTYENLLVGLNFLIRSPRVDFFIGSDNLLPSIKVNRQINNEGYHYDSRTAANMNFGFALRLGPCEGVGNFLNADWLNLRDKRGKRRKEECFTF
ncbi:hypothetical protein EDD80_103168 [Anseongella ginsenosidimutans]|uniref:DUF5723 domain-containing protein n=1 Tax=Anseongella ginsenosidimutans TaxID=496056 RepID=A0A4R3KUG2_9SPHI|nr:DUF5723 family protein [Anseongella ginsenosidimutans]QEC53418.1 hypothetical protein FRZ59_14440 [Anseongella ginsenosidimutans]TCS88305.1 hypothetical protein EDD80_103168 [Anseongella ginsenosidimutans]